MKRIRTAAAAVTLAALAGCATAADPAPTPAERAVLQPAAAPMDSRTLPAGTDLRIELNDSLSSSRSRVGDLFTATVRVAVVALNGQIVVPEGAVLTGMVTGVDDSDHAGDQAAIRLNFLRININGTTHPLAVDVIDARPDAEREGGVSVERAAAVGAAAGAVLGAIISGDRRGALIGGALGAGIGTIISLGSGEVEAVLPRGSLITVRTRDTIQLR